MKSADKTQAFILDVERIMQVVNACYTRGLDGRLYPMFQTPRKDDQIVADYQARYEIAQSHLSTAEKELMR